ncbi:MAG: sigma-54-dependent transcriptional regulator [Thermosulfidibacteraceae bacterium]
MAKVILVVDDDERMQNALKEVLSKKYVVISAYDGYQALEIIGKKKVDVVITDLKMPKMGGFDFFKSAKKLTNAPFIFITAYGTVPIAVEAMKEGAFDFILKPFSPELIEKVVAKAISYSSKASKVRENESIMTKRENISEKRLVWVSPRMAKVYEIVERVAPTKATVLITGESGTGKELVARLIHEKSGRKGRFIAINCAAIPEALLESELFGYERGAFTGATTSKEGKFELADGGTLLLDEIGDMPYSLQAKLLRVIQEGEVDRLGGKEPKKVDVRIIASTNKDLLKLVEDGKFREDLYYRLNVVPINIPPLRERKEDILPLAEYFLERFCALYKVETKVLDECARELLLNYDWPGNVRELENIMERAVILSGDNPVITSDDIFIESRMPREESLDLRIDELERILLSKVIKEVKDIASASKILGVSEDVLVEKLERYGLKL